MPLSQALQAAAASSSELLSPTKNIQKHALWIIGESEDPVFVVASECNCSSIFLECMNGTVQVLYLNGIKGRGMSRGRKGENSQVKIAT